MPIIRKSNLTLSQVNNLRFIKDKRKLTPKQKFEEVVRLHNKLNKYKVKKFHFKAIIDGEQVFLFDGLGAQYEIFENSLQGKRACRLFALYEIFLPTPEENRQGGYKIDFIKNE